MAATWRQLKIVDIAMLTQIYQYYNHRFSYKSVNCVRVRV